MGKLRDRFAKLFNFSSTDSKATRRQSAEKSSRYAVTEPLPIAAAGAAAPAAPGRQANSGTRPTVPFVAPSRQEEVPRQQRNHLASTSSAGDVSATTATSGGVFGMDVLKLDSKTLLQLSVEQRDAVLEELLRTLEQGDAAQQASAAEALFNATSEDEISRQKISAMGVVRPLVGLLRQDDVKGQMYAAYTLSALTSIEMSRDDMRECHAVRALIDVLTTSSNTVSRKGAMRALGRLARNDDCAVDIVRLGGLPPIISLLRSDDATLVRRCLIALYFIGADKPDMQRTIAEANAIPDVLQLCDSPRPDVQAEAADVMKVLARSVECAIIIHKHNGLLVLQRVAQEGEHPKSRTCAVKALQRLAEVAEYRQSIIRTGGQGLLEVHTETEAEQLAMLLYRSGDPDAQGKALKAVSEAVKEDAGVAQCASIFPVLHAFEQTS